MLGCGEPSAWSISAPSPARRLNSRASPAPAGLLPLLKAARESGGGSGSGRSAAWAPGCVLRRSGKVGPLVCAPQRPRCGRGGAVSPRRERGSGTRTNAGPPGSVSSGRRLSALRSGPRGGRHDSRGSEPPGTAVGDFGRPFRLPWRADKQHLTLTR